MGRLPRGRQAETTKKELNPIWRGIGCVMLVILTIGSYFLSDVVITSLNRANQAQAFLPGALRRGIPRQELTLVNYQFPRPVRNIGPIELTPPWTVIHLGLDLVQLAITVLVSILLFGISVLLWGLLNPPKLGPRDAPPPKRRARNDLVR